MRGSNKKLAYYLPVNLLVWGFSWHTKLCILTKAWEINKCEVPESKSTVAEIELTLNVPNMTSDVS